MTKKEHYEKAECILLSVAQKLNSMVRNDREDITCHYAYALDEPVKDLIEAMTHMMAAESMEWGWESAKKLRIALSNLVGASTKKELTDMELIVRSSPACDADKANAINAIHALIETGE